MKTGRAPHDWHPAGSKAGRPFLHEKTASLSQHATVG
jgi:hypothetical protein